jgi:hypothetical protein
LEAINIQYNNGLMPIILLLHSSATDFPVIAYLNLPLQVIQGSHQVIGTVFSTGEFREPGPAWGQLNDPYESSQC